MWFFPPFPLKLGVSEQQFADQLPPNIGFTNRTEFIKQTPMAFSETTVFSFLGGLKHSSLPGPASSQEWGFSIWLFFALAGWAPLAAFHCFQPYLLP